MPVACHACKQVFTESKGLRNHLRYCKEQVNWETRLKRNIEDKKLGDANKRARCRSIMDEERISVPDVPTIGFDNGSDIFGDLGLEIDPLPPSPPASFSRSGRRRKVPRVLKDFVPHTLAGLASHLQSSAPTQGQSQTMPTLNDLPSPSVSDIEPDPDPPFETNLNGFGLYRKYTRKPLVLPDDDILLISSMDNQACYPESVVERDSATSGKDFQPFLNMSVFRLMRWFYRGSSSKSKADLDALVHEVILADDFNCADLAGFSAKRELARLDEQGSTGAPFPTKDGWTEASVMLSVPHPKTKYVSESAAPQFEVSGFYYRPLLEVIKDAYRSPGAVTYHWQPFKLYHRSEGEHERVYSDIYNSDAMLEEDAKIQALPRDSNDDPDIERAIAAILVWSDSTHLTSFGTASLWPIYLFFGNLSKYIRGRPTALAGQHLAYIPSLPDTIQDFYLKVYKTAASASVTRFLKVDLMQKIWLLLLNDEFVNAYTHGVLIDCADGRIRRIFPRFFTYAADYPEKVLLACIKYLSRCPCPRCEIEKSQIPATGTKTDDKRRSSLRNDNTWLRNSIDRARKSIFEKGFDVAGLRVQKILGTTSLLPNHSAFSIRLSEHGFNFYSMLTVDLLHEFELGVWKAIFTHLLRLLFAEGNDTIQTLNKRFRDVPTFGCGTIRRFGNNVSGMKKLAGRDFEDILQCIIPVFEGLMPLKHEKIVLDLLFELALWHAFAKLRMHTDCTIKYFQSVTKSLTTATRRFLNETCEAYMTQELPKETAARGRRKAALTTKNPSNTPAGIPNGKSSSIPKRKILNLATYKYHALADYPDTIKRFGPTDTYNTQTGELEHRRVKKFYARTNKNNPAPQIANHQRREAILHAKRRHPTGSEALSFISPDAHYHISESQRSHSDIIGWVHGSRHDPAIKDFIPRLKDHLLARLMDVPYDGDEDTFSDTERSKLTFVNNRIYKHETIRVNYTTYDMRRAQDYINIRSHPFIMVLAHEDDEDQVNHHPYWYAKVLGVFHVKVSFSGRTQTDRMDFLWVHWFGRDKDHKGGFKTRRLHRIGLQESKDPYSYGFLNPADILRAVHLIPAFEHGKIYEGVGGDTDADEGAVQDTDEDDMDWEFYYVSMFADRDMFMRFLGGGIGHKITNNMPQVRPDPNLNREHDMEEEQLVMTQNQEDPENSSGGDPESVDEDKDAEPVDSDSDSELDFSYDDGTMDDDGAEEEGVEGEVGCDDGDEVDDEYGEL